MTSRTSAALTIFACTISGGLLALPRVFYENTFFPSFILIAIAALTTGGSLYALILLSYLNKDIKSYGTLVYWLGGTYLEKAIEFVIGIFLIGVLGGSFIIIHDYIILQTAPEILIGNLITVGIAIIVSLLSLPTNIGRLAMASTGSVLSFCFLVFTLVYYGIDEWSKWPHPHSPSSYPTNVTNHSSITNHSSHHKSSIPWFPVKKPGTDDSSGSLIISTGLALPPILYAFGCQIQIFDIYNSVNKRKGKDKLQDFLCCILSAIIGMTFTFTLVGFFGVLAFPDENIKGDVLQMLVHKGLLGSIARGVLVFAIGLSAPLIVHPTKLMLTDVYYFICPCGNNNDLENEEGDDNNNNNNNNTTLNVIMTFIIVTLSTSLALSGVNFLFVVSLMGAFIASPLFFILPGIACIKMMTTNHMVDDLFDDLTTASLMDQDYFTTTTNNNNSLLSSFDTYNPNSGVIEDQHGNVYSTTSNSSAWTNSKHMIKLSSCCQCISLLISFWLIIIGCGTFILSVYIRLGPA